MEEFRVPTTAIEAELQLVDGRVVRGVIFAAASTSAHSGPQRVDEWFSEQAQFFAFRPEGAEGTELVSKHSVVRLSVPAEAALDESTPAQTQQFRVTLECPGARFEGEVQVDMPDNRRRVLDYVNHPQTFITLHDGKTTHLIPKRQVIRIIQKPD